ncbi:unnamed protein product [Litomosoides sigmodontis]|uniref:Ground-like domain-containing protein n=1 Tax=Litomosoides sigmodontis TaxID=42156 RepID=A0A3P6TQI6_LITSI|nr:unnamed protein product [Litomosoides sigmodontis]
MLYDLQRGLLIVASLIQLLFYSAPPCFCFRPIPPWNCIPTCFQEGSYPRHQNSPDDFYQFNNVNLPEQQHQEQKSWLPFHNGEESVSYITKTTPNPINELIDATRLMSRQRQPISMFKQHDNDLLEALNILNLTTSMYPSPISVVGRTFEDISVAGQKSIPPRVLANDNSHRAHPLRIGKLTNLDQTEYSKDKLQRTFNVLKRPKAYSAKNAYQRNYLIKRAAFPSAVCNSRRLRKVMLQAMLPDVSESKRSVTKATEYAYHGIKFDVICAEGDFSYTIHAKKYCEATKENMTCFAFR